MSNFTQRLEPTNDFQVFAEQEIHQGIHQRFEKQVLANGISDAIVDPERTLSYEQLNARANVIAHALLQMSSRGGQVAFMLKNDAESVATLLGILKTGRAYVPLDPLFPKDRTAYMFKHAESELIISDYAHRDLAREVSGGKALMLLLEEIEQGQHSGNTGLKIDPQQMAYILYTSGSTGKPKGIAFSHRNLLHTTMCLTNKLRVSAADRMTQLHSTSFAASVVDIYCSLLNGAALYPWDVKERSVKGLAKWLMQEQVTSIQWIPTPFRQLMQTLELHERFKHVRLVVMASEPLTRREFDLYRQHFPDDCSLVNQMGTSESYNYYLFFANKQTQFEGSIVPAGYPVSDDREVLLLDDDHNEVKSGELGELAIRSEYMSLGYWRNPELTDKVFLKDPKGTDKRIYLTGDVGRRREDGCLLHLGRKDFQVKIRGYRIELPEVELAIKKLEHIADVAVVARTDASGELKLVAYYLSDDGRELSVTELRRKLADRLPDYMVPNVFMRLDTLPVTPTGKLDRNALPVLTDARPKMDNQFVSARNQVEAALAQIWQEVLGRKSVGVEDNFFELGGDSLQAAQVLHLVAQRCGVELGYSALIQAPRIIDLAALMERERTQSKSRLAAVADEKPGPAGENVLRGILNRILQVIALYAPGLTSLRIWLHRMRGVRIGQNVAIGTAAIVETAHPELVWIGDNVAIGIRNVIIGHFSDSIDIREDRKGPTVRICDNVYIGPNVTILPNVTIGEGAVITAGTVVNKSVPPKMMMQGNPAKAVAVCDVPLVGGDRTYEDFLKHLRPIESEPGTVTRGDGV